MNGLSSRSTRFPRPQFSLRVFLLAFTVFAVGFAVCYRWPYDEVDVQYRYRSVSPNGRTVKTFQRSWGSLQPQHVRTVAEVFRPLHRKSVLDYRNGIPHGDFALFVDGDVLQRGHYDRGERDGEWVTYTRPGMLPKFTTHWRKGQLDGPYEADYGDGRKSQVLFEAGRVKHDNGKPLANHLVQQLQAGAIDDDHIAHTLRELALYEFVNSRMIDAVPFFKDQYGIRLVFDQQHVSNLHLRLTRYDGGIDLCSGLTLLLEPHGLTADYRYGALWITTIDNAKSWRDPTGVSEIVPPPGSVLDREWNRVMPIAIETSNRPLGQVLQYLDASMNLSGDIDVSLLAPTADGPAPITVTANLKSLPLRHALGTLLYQTDCRCQLVGDKLIILPPEKP